ncbi:hypothetical protein DEO23_12625 [Brachybacterium endophyticum]|uniref:Uncharacterized protein n=1 Tax=Brachybacterium endophyticum TaxID=2182385 RepID=A0A2U2RHW7_9MICO|nr:hypothetical protein [Brachybacterium endophyticum]PWH05421.1 hypothetical protein DEO23_12625 [Brachybacterium endophyticum]
MTVDVSALAINIAVPEELQWTDERRGQEFRLTSITVRLLPDATLAAKAYGRPVGGGRGGYVSFSVPDSPELHDLIEAGAREAASRWAGQKGLG